MNHDTFHGNSPDVMRKYTAEQLVDRLYENMVDRLGSSGTVELSIADYSYISGYLCSCLATVADKGIDELVAIVDYSNQLRELREKKGK